jgi:hypothetical protein
MDALHCMANARAELSLKRFRNTSIAVQSAIGHSHKLQSEGKQKRWMNLVFSPPYTNPPVLQIASLTNGVALTWLATNQSSHLESTTNLAGYWISVTNIPVLTNATFCVAFTNAADRMFFRLSVQ